MWLIVLQRITVEFVLDILYFPVWWYSKGAKRALLFCVSWFRDASNFLAPGLWLKNIFVPMFGQSDWQGRLMSVIVRFMNVLGRSFALFIWLIITIFIFFIWILLPLVILIMLLVSMS